MFELMYMSIFELVWRSQPRAHSAISSYAPRLVLLDRSGIVAAPNCVLKLIVAVASIRSYTAYFLVALPEIMIIIIIQFLQKSLLTSQFHCCWLYPDSLLPSLLLPVVLLTLYTSGRRMEQIS